MTRAEYERERESYARSSAPREVIDEAMRKLDLEYGNLDEAKRKLILMQIEEGKADPTTPD